MNKALLAGFVAYLMIGAAAITFQGGHMPHWIDVGNGETVVAYTNGVVYTNPPGAGLMGGKRTLWQAKDGSIMSSFSLVGPGPLIYSVPYIPATPEEVAKWKKAQEILAKNT